MVRRVGKAKNMLGVRNHCRYKKKNQFYFILGCYLDTKLDLRSNISKKFQHCSSLTALMLVIDHLKNDKSFLQKN